MVQFYTDETQFIGNTPPGRPGNAAYGGRERLYRATIRVDAPKLTSTTNGTVVTTVDTILLARVPPGHRFIGGRLTASISMGTSTLAIGTAAATGKYRTAATFTATDTPTYFGNAAAMAAAESTADEDIILTVGVASLPITAGGLLVIDLEFTAP